MYSFSALDLVSKQRRRWLVTGGAGFIGSHLVEALLVAGQDVVVLDNFCTGYWRNLDEAVRNVGAGAAQRLRFLENDIRDRSACDAAVEGCDIILHQAALGSVPRSMADPLTSHDVNVTGFLNILDAGRRASVSRFIYAASSSTYGDEPNLPKREERIGNPLSPYGATKLADEIYAAVYARSYGFTATGLRYFNVFGPRQDPNGAYAAVIPKWVQTMVSGDEVIIHGDGETSRDFCYVANAVHANLLAALAPDAIQGEVFNVAVGQRDLVERIVRINQGLPQRSSDPLQARAVSRRLPTREMSAIHKRPSVRRPPCSVMNPPTQSRQASGKPCPGISRRSSKATPPETLSRYGPVRVGASQRNVRLKPSSRHNHVRPHCRRHGVWGQ